MKNESIISKVVSTTIPRFLYHYTNSRGMEGIVTSKSIWVTKVQYLNDNSELSLGLDYFKSEIHSQKRGVEKVRTNEELDAMLEALDGIEQINIGVASFTEMGDQLSQWRGYCKVGNGYSLGFTGNKLFDAINAGEYRLVSCVYTEQKHRLMAKELINTEPITQIGRKSSINGLEFLQSALFVALIIKSEGFKEEREWRLISSIKSYENAKFRHGSFSLIPYWEVKLDNIDLLQKVIIGPTPEPKLSHDALQGFLVQIFLQRKKGIPPLKNIQHSTIPFREM